MQELFFSLLRDPSLDTFLDLRERIIDTSQYFPYSAEFYEMGELLEQEEYTLAVKLFQHTLPNLLLSPGAHLMVSYAYEAQNNTEMAEFEKQVAFLLISCLLETGDGTLDNPYLILRISDEHDVLNALGKARREQALMADGDRILDRHTCEDETDVYFDVTTPYLRNVAMMSQQA